MQAMGSIGHEAHQIDYNEVARQGRRSLGRAGVLRQRPGDPRCGQRGGVRRRQPDAAILAGAGEFGGCLRRRSRHAGKRPALCPRRLDPRSRTERPARARRRRHLRALLRHRRSGAADRLRRAHRRHRAGSPAGGDASVGVAGGDDKVAPLLGALRGGYINVLISDERTLQALLRLEDENSRAVKGGSPRFEPASD